MEQLGTSPAEVVDISRGAGLPHHSQPIWDPPFWEAHRRLVRLANHVLDVPTSFGPDVQNAARLGELHVVEFANVPTGNNRRASTAEWKEVETRTHTIWAALSEAQRRKFITTQLPGWFSYLMSALLAVALSSVFSAFLIRQGVWTGWPGQLLIPFMLFVVAMGAMGASASIGMNALSLQEDASFEISNTKLVWLRLMVGALFGTMLTFPWEFPVFQSFISALEAGPPSGKVEIKQEQFTQALWLLMPFVFGFSTSLVILVLSRAVDSVQTFFGKTAQTVAKS